MRLGLPTAATLGGAGLLVIGVAATQAADLPWGGPPPAYASAYASAPAPVPYPVPLSAYGFEPLPVTDPCVRKTQPVMDAGGHVAGYRVLRLCN